MVLIGSNVAAHETEAAKALNDLVEQYFEESLEASPMSATFIGDARYNDRYRVAITKEARAEDLAREKKFLARLKDINRADLEGQDMLSYDIFKYNLEGSIEASQFPSHLLPINQMFSFHSFFPVLGSGRSAQPFSTVQDYENWLSRAEQALAWFPAAEANMREGMKQGIVLPKAIVKEVLPQLQAQVTEDPEQSMFMMPVQSFPDTFSADDQARLRKAFHELTEKKIIPAYNHFHKFLSETYLPASRDSVGYAALPGGREWYRYLIQANTSLEKSADEIHEIGLSEVARIRGEMEKVMKEVGFEGDLAAFFQFLKTDDRFYFESEKELVQAYTDLRDRVNKVLPQFFDVMPKADYEVRPIEAFRAASSPGAFYQSPSEDGSRPGIFYINTHNLKAQPKFGMETLSIHEASPGHHFQISLTQELKNLPRFRRFGGGVTAYTEGWALYCESIGKEMGFFTDPYQYYGKLSDEMLRAMRLVVDTGLHHKGWTREQARAYMQENSSLSDTDIHAEVDRYIVIPGQALSYKIGQLHILDLRAYAEKELGEKFDIREFHNQVLTSGILPLPVLEKKIKRWVSETKTK